MKTRIYAVVPLASWQQLRDTVQARGRGDVWLHIGGLKGFVDGSLGSHTAAMIQPFTDAPNDTGLFVNTPEHLYEWTSGADNPVGFAAGGLVGFGSARLPETQLGICRRARCR